MDDAQKSGFIFNIQNYSVHDGPGIRTMVFLKGCPLRCRWCSNPESQTAGPEICWNDTLCIGCGSCVRSCPSGAISAEPEGIRRSAALCSGCGKCLEACPAKAMFSYGMRRTVAEVLDEVEKDSLFYSRSSGGMTLSGGEALFQPEFALALLREARERHIRRALETCALCPDDVYLEAAGLLNYLFTDVKSLDAEKHRRFTGADNALILSNIEAVR
ncbi:MAG: glycyl-radical enzyme activating protein, partial [Mailhella sp.]|nr:glycyl-radical enzyme activating protein [Mailhella sp.]